MFACPLNLPVEPAYGRVMGDQRYIPSLHATDIFLFFSFIPFIQEEAEPHPHPHPEPLQETRQKMHALIDEAFSLVGKTSPSRKNAVVPTSADLSHSQV